MLLTAASVRAQAPAEKPQFYLGADISTLNQQRDGAFTENGQPADALKVFMDRGWTCFRLRIWVNPRAGRRGGAGAGGTVPIGLEYTTALAKRIKAAGGTFMLDFHYSDTWADPQHQDKPSAWADMSVDELEKQVETYTAETMKHLKENGATPDFVQVGNEITGGTLWPDGRVKVPPSDIKTFVEETGGGNFRPFPDPYDDEKHWDNLTRFIKAGVRGVRSATVPADNCRIIIHIDCGGDWKTTEWYFDHLAKAGVEYDIIGQSYYPNWHGTIQNLRDNLRETINKYHKDVMVVEVAYPSTGGRPGPGDQNMIWPKTPEGQKQFLQEVIKAVKEAPDGKGIGTFWWIGGWFGQGTALFNQDGSPKPVLDALMKPSPSTAPTTSPVQ